MCRDGGLVFAASRGFPSPSGDEKPSTYAELLAGAKEDDKLQNVRETSVDGHRAFHSATLTPKVMVCMVGVDLAGGPLLVVAGEDHPSPILVSERAGFLRVAEQFCDSVKVLAQ